MASASLSRRKLPRRFSYLPEERLFTTPGQGARVSPAHRASLAELRLTPSLRGRLLRAAFRVSPILLRLKYADGREGYSRLLADQAPSGLPLGDLPRDAAELARWLGGLPAAPVSSFFLSGPGLNAYGEVLGLAWSRPASK